MTSPNSAYQRRKKRFWAYIEAYLIDHGILRKLYRNCFQISSKAFRSNHPSRSFLRKMKAKHGIHTVINLRGGKDSGQYLFEKEACDELGITLLTIPVSSRRLPKVDFILKIKEAFDQVEYPILMHCKSGADRAGLASVLYKHFVDGDSISKALQQLHWRYGHVRWADTGKLDYFFDNYLAFEKEHPDIEFLDWVQNHYDRDALDASFEASGWANILVNHILRRE